MEELNLEACWDMVDILEHFCWKVENGYAHSTQTYNQAKEVLERIMGENHKPEQRFSMDEDR